MEKRDSGDSESDYVGLTVMHALSVCDAGSDKWIIDSGATCHMSTDRSQFSAYRPLDIPLGVTLEVETPSGKGKKCNLSDVLYIPNLSYNLLSVSRSTDTTKSTVFTSSGCDFLNAEGKVVATGKRIGDFYYLNCRDTQQATAVKHGGGMSQEELWHRGYGHLGVQNMRKLVAEEMSVKNHEWTHLGCLGVWRTLTFPRTRGRSLTLRLEDVSSWGTV